MHIGITGATGLIGSCLRRLSEAEGHRVTSFSRKGGDHGTRKFSLNEPVDSGGLDAVVHLAGEPILGLWTKKKRDRILQSRILGTRRVVEGLQKASLRPQVLVCASAVGYYGDTGESECDEQSSQGEGFLAEVTAAWEAEALRANGEGVRTVLLRIGFVLGQGGALGLIAPIFRIGLGGCLGSGRQWMSGVHLDDVAGMALWAVKTPSIRGPVNAVMPVPFRNSDFTKTLAQTVQRPAFLPVPAFLLKLALGELSGVMLNNCRVMPAVALGAGYSHHHPTLESSLAASVEKNNSIPCAQGDLD